ncbi:MAG: hypothetical protein ACRDJ9_01370 [Dehalococcoidia bacterium]
MNTEVRRRVLIELGGVIRIQSDELPAGAEADVVVYIRSQTQPGRYASLFGSGRGAFRSPDEADAFLRRERDAWEG